MGIINFASFGLDNSYFTWLYIGSIGVSAAGLTSGLGLRWRKEWARIAATVLLALGAAFWTISLLFNLPSYVEIAVGDADYDSWLMAVLFLIFCVGVTIWCIQSVQVLRNEAVRDEFRA